MSKGNPKKAVAALLPLPIKAGKDVVVKPMTLGMWAALERINSPLIITPEEGHTVDTLELIPSLYLLTHDPIEVFRGNILELSMAWADTVPVKTMDLIREAAYRQMGAAFDVIPEPDQKAVKKSRRISRLPRRMGRVDLPLDDRRNPLARPARDNLPLPPAGGAEGE